MGEAVAYVLIKDVTDPFYGTLEQREVLGVYRDEIAAECEMQRLRDAGHRDDAALHLRYRIEEVPLHG